MLARLKQNRNLIRILLIVGAFSAVYIFEQFQHRLSTPKHASTIVQAIANKQSNVMVEADGMILKSLPDDNDGSRHQRFLVELESGHTVLIAHNIDLAPKVQDLRKGEPISFNGEYEWNSKGGVVHWTHHDPANTHPPGWLKFRGRKYD